MPTLINEWNMIGSGDDIKGRVTAAVLESANAVIIESPATTNHANRLIWARAALKDEAGLKLAGAQAFIAIIGIAAVVNQGNAATDALIRSSVTGVIDTILATGG